VVIGAAPLLTVDLLFLAANLTKLVHGAWLPLLIAVTAFTVLTTWQRGRLMITDRRQEEEGDLANFVEELHERRPPLARVPGTAVFLNRGKTTAPLAMRANVEHNEVLHQHAVILSLETMPVPYLDDADRLVIDDLGYADDGISHVLARHGYMENPHVPEVLARAAATDLEAPVDLGKITYFLSRIEIRIGDTPGMARWRKHLFIATSRLTTDAADHFALPREQILIMGSRLQL
jgi:KUP system potassium uptake protein